MVIYLGILYLICGIIFLLIPLLYIELGRPRDLIKACFNLVIGMLLLLNNNVFDRLYYSILIFITLLFILFLMEIFSLRWNQLTDQEKNKIKTVVELKKNVSTLMEAISLARKDFLNSGYILKLGSNNEIFNKKKWVRNSENDNIKTSNKNNLQTIAMQKKATLQSKKDRINEEKK